MPKVIFLYKMKYSSKIIEDAVSALSQLPSVGKKSALRLVLHLVKRDAHVEEIISSLHNLKENLKHCQECFNLSDHEICSICSDPKRNEKVMCVVESIRDVMAIEDTSHYDGLYHVLGGVISPLEGIDADQLRINELVDRIKTKGVTELIMGISPTIEGDTTIFYLSKRLKDTDVKISMLSRGVAFGGDLEYTDELTLGRSILARVPYSHSLAE